MTTHDEFMKKAKTLKDQGMERLVLDLSSNPGGVMQSSIEIADEMLGDGMEIVQTKGRDKSMNRTWRASGGGALEDMPIIVLVSQRSASASEILAGALQDHDRALLVGQRTFGKALVQKQFELEDGSLLQMTTGRYYTPAGRLIQTPYEDGNRQNYYQEKFSDYDKALFNPSEYKESIADSLRYQTDHGRVVFGGGGIMPDYVVAPDTSALEQLIRSPAISNQVALKWLTAHEDRLRSEWGDREQAYIDNFSVEPAMVDSFWTYAQRNGVTLTDSPDEVDRSEGVFPRSAVAASREDLEVYLKGALASHLYGTRAAQPILNRVNPAFREALSLWDRAQQLASYHTASASPVNKN
jgi:carboxyl-terminal processing protease